MLQGELGRLPKFAKKPERPWCLEFSEQIIGENKAMQQGNSKDLLRKTLESLVEY